MGDNIMKNDGIQRVELRLYSTPGCHLCELALALLAEVRRAYPDTLPDIEVCEIDIAQDDALMARYGVRIPVLQRCNDDAELYWPFDGAILARFLLAPENKASIEQ